MKKAGVLFTIAGLAGLGVAIWLIRRGGFPSLTSSTPAPELPLTQEQQQAAYTAKTQEQVEAILTPAGAQQVAVPGATQEQATGAITQFVQQIVREQTEAEIMAEIQQDCGLGPAPLYAPLGGTLYTAWAAQPKRKPTDFSTPWTCQTSAFSTFNAIPATPAGYEVQIRNLPALGGTSSAFGGGKKYRRAYRYVLKDPKVAVASLKGYEPWW